MILNSESAASHNRNLANFSIASYLKQMELPDISLLKSRFPAVNLILIIFLCHIQKMDLHDDNHTEAERNGQSETETWDQGRINVINRLFTSQ